MRFMQIVRLFAEGNMKNLVDFSTVFNLNGLNIVILKTHSG